MTIAEKQCNFTNTYIPYCRHPTKRNTRRTMGNQLPRRFPKLPTDGRWTSERAGYPTSILQNSRI